jgi:hypothetical protein
MYLYNQFHILACLSTFPFGMTAYQGSSSGPGWLAHSLPITSSAFPIPLAPFGAQNLPDMPISSLSANLARIGAASSGSIAIYQSCTSFVEKIEQTYLPSCRRIRPYPHLLSFRSSRTQATTRQYRSVEISSFCLSSPLVSEHPDGEVGRPLLT